MSQSPSRTELYEALRSALAEEQALFVEWLNETDPARRQSIASTRRAVAARFKASLKAFNALWLRMGQEILDTPYRR